MNIFKSKTGVLVDINSSNLNDAKNIIEHSGSLEFVIGYKINAGLIIENSIKKTVTILKERTGKPLIYDHQRFGNDIPESYNGSLLEIVKDAGIDGIIIFPLSGKKVLEAIAAKCEKTGLLPVISGDLSYKGYFLDEGGYIDEEVQQRIYLDAASLGISHFMMSCNRIDRIKIYCHQMTSIIGTGQLKIFFTAVDSFECTNLPDACEHVKQNRAYSVFSMNYTDRHDYIQNLKRFYSGFLSRLGMEKG